MPSGLGHRKSLRQKAHILVRNIGGPFVGHTCAITGNFSMPAEKKQRKQYPTHLGGSLPPLQFATAHLSQYSNSLPRIRPQNMRKCEAVATLVRGTKGAPQFASLCGIACSAGSSKYLHKCETPIGIRWNRWMRRVQKFRLQSKSAHSIFFKILSEGIYSA